MDPAEPVAAAGMLAARLHGELWGVARRHLSRERRDWRNEMEPASLVNEAYLRLVRQRGLNEGNEAQFMALASVCMGRVLIDGARRRNAVKRPHAWVELDGIDVGSPSRVESTVAVHELLARLQAESPRRAALIRLRFFDGLSVPEIARDTALSAATVKRELSAGLARLKMLLQH